MAEDTKRKEISACLGVDYIDMVAPAYGGMKRDAQIFESTLGGNASKRTRVW